MLQRTDVRTRAHPHLAGDFVTDFLKVSSLNIAWRLIIDFAGVVVLVLQLLQSNSTGEGDPTPSVA